MSQTPGEGGPPPDARDGTVSLVVETLAVLLATVGYPLVYHGLARRSDTAHATSALLVATLVQDVGIVALILFLTRAAPRPWLLPVTRREWARELFWGLVLAGGLWTVYLASPHLARWLDLGYGASYWANSFRVPGVAVSFLWTAPISCLRQELLYRFYFQQRFTRILGGKEDLAILLVSWMFAAAHGFSPASTLAVFLVGALLGIVFRVSRRVPRLVIAHAIFNVVSCLMTPWR